MEFALVLPVLILFVFGIVEFGRAYNAKIELTSAVREGARAAAVGGPTITEDAVRQETRDAAPGLNGARIAVTSVRCAGTPVPVNAEVSATYPFAYDVPLLGRRTANLTAKGVMRCGG